MEEELFYNSVNDKIIGTFDISQDTVALKTLNDKIARDSGRVFAGSSDEHRRRIHACSQTLIPQTHRKTFPDFFIFTYFFIHTKRNRTPFTPTVF